MMSNIVPFPVEETFAVYEVHYTHDGREYALDIFAQSFADAEARLNSIKQKSTLAGRVVDECN